MTTAPPRLEKAERTGIQSVEIGARLLDCLQQAPGPLGLSDIAKRADLSPSKARNYLVSLVRAELVQQDAATARYDLGAGALRLGLTALGRIEPLDIAFEEMRRLQPSIPATLFLSVWGNKGPVIVRWLEGREQITVEVRTGSVLPATRSATGWTFLAYLPAAVTDAVVAAERSAVAVSDTDLEGRCWAVQRHGLGRIDGDLLPGIAGLAVPIRDHEGRVRTVVSAIGRRNSIDIRYNGRIADQLRTLKEAVERRIGG